MFLKLLCIAGYICVSGLAEAQSIPHAMPCKVDIRAVDIHGDRTTAEIVFASLYDPGGDPNKMIGTGDHTGKPWLTRISPTTIAFVKELLFKQIRVEVKTRHPERFGTRVFLTACNQVKYVTIDAEPSQADFAFTTIIGRFKGCEHLADLWMIAVPMFGPNETDKPISADVDRQTRRFTITGNFGSARYVIVVGLGKTPLVTVAKDLLSDGRRSEDLEISLPVKACQ